MIIEFDRSEAQTVYGATSCVVYFGVFVCDLWSIIASNNGTCH